MDKNTWRYFKRMDKGKIFSLWWGPNFQGYTTCYYHVGDCEMDWNGPQQYRLSGLQDGIYLETVTRIQAKNANGEDALIYIPPLVRFSRSTNYIKEKNDNDEAVQDETKEDNEDDDDYTMDSKDGIKNMMSKPAASSNHNRRMIYGQQTPRPCKKEADDDGYNWHDSNRDYQMDNDNDKDQQSFSIQ